MLLCFQVGHYVAVVVGAVMMALMMVLAFPLGFMVSLGHSVNLKYKRQTARLLNTDMGDRRRLAALLGHVPTWISQPLATEKLEWLNSIMVEVRGGWNYYFCSSSLVFHPI